MNWRIETPLGDLLLSEDGAAIRSLRFAKAGEGAALPTPRDGLSKAAERWLNAYFTGEAPRDRLPLAPAGTAFQRRIWQAAGEIPYGETRSYGALARQLGCGSARAVGAALGKNPIWILIPCHRVVGADGALTGYAGGLEKKAALLKLEKKRSL